MEACWKVLGFRNYPASTPRVRVLSVKTEEEVNYALSEGHSTDMLIYFHRPEALHHRTYTEMFAKYVVTTQIPARYQNHADQGNDNLFTVHIPGLSARYICRRAATSHPAITRMKMLYVSAGDVFYQRLILRHETPTSFEEARSHNGEVFQTFQEAAVAKGYVADDCQEIIGHFAELLPFASPNELRGLFCILMMNGFPMRAVYREKRFWDALTEDFVSQLRQADSRGETFRYSSCTPQKLHLTKLFDLCIQMALITPRKQTTSFARI